MLEVELRDPPVSGDAVETGEVWVLTRVPFGVDGNSPVLRQLRTEMQRAQVVCGRTAVPQDLHECRVEAIDLVGPGWLVPRVLARHEQQRDGGHGRKVPTTPP